MSHHLRFFISSTFILPRPKFKRSTVTALWTSDSPSNAFWDYNLLFFSQRSELHRPIHLQPIFGSLPTDFPAGTYYLVGPGLFSDDYGSTVHPLDGHGYLRSFDFSNGGVNYSARYVSTDAEREERKGEKEWRFTHRGPFSVLRGGTRIGNVKVMKNVANTSVVQWGGRLLCLWEGGEPYEIDPQSLETLGPVDLTGVDADQTVKDEDWRKELLPGGIKMVGIDIASCFLKPILHGLFNMPPKRLLAHYKIDPERKRLLMLSCNAEDMLLARSNFTFYEFDLDFKLKQKREFIIPDHLMIHDWTFTDSYYILVGNRIKLDISASVLALCGTQPMISSLSVNPTRRTTPVYVLPRFANDKNGIRMNWRKPIETPRQFWATHSANAFEERDDLGNVEIQLQLSACSYQWFDFHRMFGYNWRNAKLDPSFMNTNARGEDLLPHLIQVSIKLDSRGKCAGCSAENLSNKWNRPADFTVINPAFCGRKNAYIYTSAASGKRRLLPSFPFDSVVKLNTNNGKVASWSSGSRAFVGEPAFVPRSIYKGDAEDDGYILVVEYAVSKQKCYLVVLDAKKIGGKDALVAKFEVPKKLRFPFGFHGFWANRDLYN
ncbi:carotenoid cleavage dioxygenase 7 isoform X1 [Carex rostrata]